MAAFGLLLAVLLTACSGGTAGTGGADPVGTWGTGAAGQPSLTIEPHGRFSGTDGCNRLFGSWAFAGRDRIVFSDVATTEMYCQGVDTWLSGAAAATVSADTLEVTDASGQAIGTLPRSP